MSEASGKASSDGLSLEERRLALDQLIADRDYALRRDELNAKAAERGWLSRVTPLTTTIFAGIVAAGGSVLANFEQGQTTLRNELIVKMVDVGSAAQARNNLKFLIDVGLIGGKLAERIESSPTVAVTGTVNSSGQAFEQIQNDDQALDLILKFEGGFIAAGTASSNGGVSLAMLSTYLNRAATLDDLRNLSSDTIKNIYKQLYLGPLNGISSPLVRTAYLNIAVLNGPAPALKLLQVAVGRVLAKPMAADGIIGPATVSLINSVPTPDLLVENLNCLELDRLKALPEYGSLGSGLLYRLRAFSPLKLSGVCPELGDTNLLAPTQNTTH